MNTPPTDRQDIRTLVSPGHLKADAVLEIWVAVAQHQRIKDNRARHSGSAGECNGTADLLHSKVQGRN